jgi:hypothetical protein
MLVVAAGPAPSPPDAITPGSSSFGSTSLHACRPPRPSRGASSSRYHPHAAVGVVACRSPPGRRLIFHSSRWDSRISSKRLAMADRAPACVASRGTVNWMLKSLRPPSPSPVHCTPGTAIATVSKNAAAASRSQLSARRRISHREQALVAGREPHQPAARRACTSAFELTIVVASGANSSATTRRGSEGCRPPAGRSHAMKNAASASSVMRMTGKNTIIDVAVEASTASVDLRRRPSIAAVAGVLARGRGARRSPPRRRSRCRRPCPTANISPIVAMTLSEPPRRYITVTVVSIDAHRDRAEPPAASSATRA